MKHINEESIGSLLEVSFPERAPILGPWLQQESLVMVYAWRGVGKTFFSLAAAQCVASGGSFLKWQSPKKHSVLYIDGEMGRKNIRDRYVQIDAGASCSAPMEATKLVSFEHFGSVIPNLGHAKHQEFYAEKAKNYDVIVIDNIATCIRSIGNEREENTWGRVQEWAINLRNTGKCVIFIHHSGKNGSQRGISAREDVLDTVVCLKRPSGIPPNDYSHFELSFEKTRHFYGLDAEPLYVRFWTENGAVKWSHKSLKERRRDEVKELRRGGQQDYDICTQLGITMGELQGIVRGGSDAEIPF